MLAHRDHSTEPAIFVADADYEVLAKISNESTSPGTALLRHELERATVVPDGDNFVRLNSSVEFTDLSSGRRRIVTLVGPDQADMDANRLSVTAPAGAALLGLRAGDVFRWAFQGRRRVLSVNRIVRPG
jgi:regulator of nucleoside diphosphate kinase